MKVLTTRPMTAPRRVPPPAGFDFLKDEGELSGEFGRALPLPPFVTEQLVRVWLALWLLVRRRHYDAVVTGRYGEIFAIIQRLWPFGRRPHLLLDVEWYATHGSGWRRRVNRWIHRCVASPATRIQVFCRIEADNYAERFRMRREDFVHIPYCSDLHGAEPDSATESYIFTGGLHHRDYGTLFNAVRDFAVELHVAAPAEHFTAAAVPPNVRILGVIPPAEYWRNMAAARFVVLSLEPGVARCPGVITYVAAMHFGKCVVVNEPAGAVDYIDAGSTGFVVAPRDSHALKETIGRLIDNPSLVEATGRCARIAARERFSGHRYWELVARTVDEMVKPPHRA
jgi:glycosyltransferase involved in cell wall biosynthesis